MKWLSAGSTKKFWGLLFLRGCASVPICHSSEDCILVTMLVFIAYILVLDKV